jgi:dephospho-CoA kinase
MRRVALTGGIATGKSYVLARLAAAGIPTIDADRLVHAALRPGSPAASLVLSRFGPGVVGAGGAIDREALAAIVFSDAQARRDLEAILHPHVYRLIDEWFGGLQNDSPRVRPSSDARGALSNVEGRKSETPSVADPTRPTRPTSPTRPTRPNFAVADIPLLYETGHEQFFDRVIVTSCARERQLERLRQRGSSDEQALARLEAQWPIEEKTRRADYVIETSGTFEETDRQVEGVIQRLKAEG